MQTTTVSHLWQLSHPLHSSQSTLGRSSSLRSKEYSASVYISSTKRKRKKRKISTKFQSKSKSENPGPSPPSLLIPLFHPSLQSYSYSAFSPSAYLSWSGFGSSGPVFSTTGDTSASVTSTSSAFARVSLAVSAGAAGAGGRLVLRLLRLDLRHNRGGFLLFRLLLLLLVLARTFTRLIDRRRRCRHNRNARHPRLSHSPAFSCRLLAHLAGVFAFATRRS
ncbi:hypothetical protein DFH08DRAFT_458125 [Mycena albidolilacea]|uniref:Uncharacterized protein n=1 Tax=Mycena albidolilacea TaxID=1033008 RepID=A0AAD6Z777_9AGAR|nr:hypothetical protein DFH08DRAFT_458125 [Mycena albidolilacea]